MSALTVDSETKRSPSKLPTKYCPPLPPATEPGLMLTTMTHLVFLGLPSTASSNRSAHSQIPAVEFAGPKSERCVQFLRFFDL